jgi:hypothetical protein
MLRLCLDARHGTFFAAYNHLAIVDYCRNDEEQQPAEFQLSIADFRLFLRTDKGNQLMEIYSFEDLWDDFSAHACAMCNN